MNQFDLVVIINEKKNQLTFEMASEGAIALHFRGKDAIPPVIVSKDTAVTVCFNSGFIQQIEAHKIGVALVLKKEFPRGTMGVACSCGGYAGLVQSTDEEKRAHDCARGCCVGSFVCKLCGQRWVGRAEAPEMDES